MFIITINTNTKFGYFRCRLFARFDIILASFRIVYEYNYIAICIKKFLFSYHPFLLYFHVFFSLWRYAIIRDLFLCFFTNCFSFNHNLCVARVWRWTFVFCIAYLPSIAHTAHATIVTQYLASRWGRCFWWIFTRNITRNRHKYEWPSWTRWILAGLWNSYDWFLHT